MKNKTKCVVFWLIFMLAQSENAQAFNVFNWVGLKISTVVFGSIWRHIQLAMPYPDVETLFGPIEQKRNEVKKELTEKIGQLLKVAQNNQEKLMKLNGDIGTTKTKFDTDCMQIKDKIELMKNSNQELVTSVNTKFTELKQWSANELVSSNNNFETWSKKVRYANHLFKQQTTNRKNLFEARFNKHKLDYETRLSKMQTLINEQIDLIGEQVTVIKTEMERVQENAAQMQPQLDVLAEKITMNNEKNNQEIKNLNLLLEGIEIQLTFVERKNEIMFQPIDKLEKRSLLKPSSLMTTFGQIRTMSKNASAENNQDLNLN